MARRSFLTNATAWLRNPYLVGIAVLLLGFMFMSAKTMAVSENTDNVPPWIQYKMYGGRPASQPYGSWGQKPGGGGPYQCGNSDAALFNHAMWSWLSVAGDNENDTVTIVQGTDSVDVWFNNLAAICDSVINSAGNITDKTLKESRSKVLGFGASGPGDPHVDWASGDAARVSALSLTEAYFYNFRYIKTSSPPGQPASSPATMPDYKPFKITGLDDLVARDQPYEITVSVNSRPVNRYVKTNGQTEYRCVANPGVIADDGYDDPDCKEVPNDFPIKVLVSPRYAGTCQITKINGQAITGGEVYLMAGQSFTADFKVENIGINAWDVGEPVDQKFRLVPVGATVWRAPNLVPISGYGSPPLLQGLAGSPASQRQKEYTVGGFTVPPDASRDMSFTWRVTRAGGLAMSNANNTCTLKIKARVNEPFMRVSGGDTYAGVRFGNTSQSCEAYPGITQARQANIGTNGRWQYPQNSAQEVTARVFGASTSQYAVFASGLIGNPNRDTNNNFLGNGAHVRDTTDESGDQIFDKDALFANEGFTPAQSEYGQYYDSATGSMPCFDISRLERMPQRTGGATLSSLVNGSTDKLIQVDSLTVDAVTVPVGRQLVVLSNDPAGITIDTQITYANSPDVAQTPFLMIISKGPVYIKSSVSRIDAHLVAFPNYDIGGNLTAKSGTIDTCSDALLGQAGSWPTGTNKLTIGSCDDSQLVVNGSLIAKKVLWKRTRGSINYSGITVDSTCTFLDGVGNDQAIFQQRLKTCAAEHVNFSPEAYFTNPLNQLGPVNGAIGSAPLNTIELPPTF